MHDAFKSFCTRHWLAAEPLQHHLYRMPLLLVALLFGSGTWIGLKSSSIDGTVWLALSFILGITSILLKRAKQNEYSVALVTLTLFFVGLAYGTNSKPPADDDLSRVLGYDWQPCAVRVQVTSPAVWSPNPNHRPIDASSQPWKTYWEVRCIEVRDQQTWRPINALCRLSTEGRIDSFLPGDTIEVHGQYRKISPAANPGGFDFAEFSRWQSQYVSIRTESSTQLKRLSSGLIGPNRLRGLAIREIDRSLTRWVSHGQAPLAAALVFGQRQQVDWQAQQELMATGTLHMLAISGMHVEIIASVLLAVCVTLSASNRTTFWVLVLSTWMYTALAGAQPPVVRAAIQITLFALANWIGARARLANLLGGAAFVVVLMSASNLENVGVQLSFIAVATIGLFVSSLRHGAQRDRLKVVLSESQPFWKRSVERVKIAAWDLIRLSWWISLFTCPLIWTHFHVISPVSIPLNVLIGIPVTIGLIAGLLTGFFGWLTPVGWLCGQVCGGALQIVCWIVNGIYGLPNMYWYLPSPHLGWTVLFYTIILGWLLLLGRRYMAILGSVLVIWIIVGMAPLMISPRGHLALWCQSPVNNKALTCTFLSVGHGTSVMIELPDGRVWLYDAGHLGADQRSHEEIAAALWHANVSRIDRLILSHADSDHYNASIGLQHRFAIGSIVSTAQFWQSTDREVQSFIDQLRRGTSSFESWNHPHSIVESGVEFRVLHPTQNWRGRNDNANSLCLQIEYCGQRILLPGDLEGAGLNHLVTMPARPCQVVMAPHHGSTTHDPSALLAWCQSQVVVISGGVRATRPEVLTRYSQVPKTLAITHRDGAVQVCLTAAGQLQLRRWNQIQWQDFSEPAVIASKHKQVR